MRDDFYLALANATVRALRILAPINSEHFDHIIKGDLQSPVLKCAKSNLWMLNVIHTYWRSERAKCVVSDLLKVIGFQIQPTTKVRTTERYVGLLVTDSTSRYGRTNSLSLFSVLR